MAAKAKTKRVWEGDKRLNRLLVSVDELVLHPRNPRLGNVEMIAESLARFGQVRPILVNDKNSRVIAGNHTLRAAKERLGWTHIAVVHATLDETEEEAYLLTDNRLGSVGGYDGPLLVQVLNDLAESGRLEGTGYTPDDLDDLIVEQDALTEEMSRADGFEPSDDDPPLDQRSPMILQFVDRDRLDQFKVYVSILRKELEVDSDEDAVYAAVEREAKAL